MSDDAGYFHVSRKLFSNPNDPRFRDNRPVPKDYAPIALFRIARFVPGVVETKNGPVELNRGEFVASYATIARLLRWTPKEARTWISLLVQTDTLRVVRSVDKVGTVYFFPNYDRFQGHLAGQGDGHSEGQGQAPVLQRDTETAGKVKGRVKGKQDNKGVKEEQKNGEADASPCSGSRRSPGSRKKEKTPEQVALTKDAQAVVAKIVEVGLNGVSPPRSEYVKKIKKVERLLANKHVDREQLLVAVDVMRSQVFPYNQGKPFSVEKFIARLDEVRAEVKPVKLSGRDRTLAAALNEAWRERFGSGIDTSNAALRFATLNGSAPENEQQVRDVVKEYDRAIRRTVPPEYLNSDTPDIYDFFRLWPKFADYARSNNAW